MTKIQFDVNVTNGVTDDIANVVTSVTSDSVDASITSNV